METAQRAVTKGLGREVHLKGLVLFQLEEPEG